MKASGLRLNKTLCSWYQIEVSKVVHRHGGLSYRESVGMVSCITVPSLRSAHEFIDGIRKSTVFRSFAVHMIVTEEALSGRLWGSEGPHSLHRTRTAVSFMLWYPRPKI